MLILAPFYITVVKLFVTVVGDFPSLAASPPVFGESSVRFASPFSWGASSLFVCDRSKAFSFEL